MTQMLLFYLAKAAKIVRRELNKFNGSFSKDCQEAAVAT